MAKIKVTQARQAKIEILERFVVIVTNGMNYRAFGPYRDYRTAKSYADNMGGFVVSLEGKDPTKTEYAKLLAADIMTKTVSKKKSKKKGKKS